MNTSSNKKDLMQEIFKHDFNQMIFIVLVGLLSVLMLYFANKSGSQDRSFLVYKAETKDYVSVTERNIRSKFPLAPKGAKCDLMGICIVDGKTMLQYEKYGE